MSGRSASATLRSDSARAEDSFELPRRLLLLLVDRRELLDRDRRSSSSVELDEEAGSCAGAASRLQPGRCARGSAAGGRSAGRLATRRARGLLPEDAGASDARGTEVHATPAPKSNSPPSVRAAGPETRAPSRDVDSVLRTAASRRCSFGIATPKNFSTVGAMSMMLASLGGERPVRRSACRRSSA